MTDIQPAEPAEPAAPAPEPVARFAGTLYADGGGGFVLALRLEGEDADRHVHVPPHLLKMAGMFAGGGGGLLDMVRRMMGR